MSGGGRWPGRRRPAGQTQADRKRPARRQAGGRSGFRAAYTSSRRPRTSSRYSSSCRSVQRPAAIIRRRASVLPAASRCEPVYEAIRQTVGRSAWVVPDETGWHVGGHPAWLHTLVGPEATAYVIDPTRSGAVAEAVLGLDYGGTMIHDGWSLTTCSRAPGTSNASTTCCAAPTRWRPSWSLPGRGSSGRQVAVRPSFPLPHNRPDFLRTKSTTSPRNNRLPPGPCPPRHNLDLAREANQVIHLRGGRCVSAAVHRSGASEPVAEKIVPVRFPSVMLVSRSAEPTSDLVERLDDYYVYLKPHDADDAAILGKTRFPGKPPLWIPMPPH